MEQFEVASKEKNRRAIGTSLPSDVYEKLSKRADKNNLSIAELVRQMINFCLVNLEE